MSLLYLIGEPGVGKSSIMRELLPSGPRAEFDRPLAHTVYADGSLHLGNPRPSNAAHPGTDTLSMGALPVACRWLPGFDPQVRIYGEGDRLANVRLWSAMRRAGHDVRVVLLEGPAAERRAGRGSNQDPRWLAGRATRVRNLAGQWPVERVNTGGLTVSQAAGVVAGLF